MKLVTPQIEIPEDDPFANDAFDRKEFAEALTNLIRRSEDQHLVIALDAPWGEGKTTFVKMWKAYLEKTEGMNVIYFDAFSTDYTNDAFIAIVSEIYKFFDEKLDSKKRRLTSFKKKASELGCNLVKFGIGTAVKAATSGAIEAEDINNAITSLIEKKISSHREEKRYLSEFKKEFYELIRTTSEGKNTKKLIVIIDELDRCKPSYVVDVLESIKHIFSTNGIVFVIAINRDQLDEIIRHTYGRGLNASTYLQKFIHLEVKLPKSKDPKERTGSFDDYTRYTEKLFEEHFPSEFDHKSKLKAYFAALSNHFNISLRQMERALTNLIILHSTAPAGIIGALPEITPLLAIIKATDNRTFKLLQESELEYSEITKMVPLRKNYPDYYNRSYYVEHVDIMLKFCTLSDTEYEKLSDDDPAKTLKERLWRFTLERKDIIPLFCRYMNLAEPLKK